MGGGGIDQHSNLLRKSGEPSGGQIGGYGGKEAAGGLYSNLLSSQGQAYGHGLGNLVESSTISQAPTASDSHSHYSQSYNQAVARNDQEKSSAGSLTRFRPGGGQQLQSLNGAKRQQMSDFLDRFQGKTSHM
jgi:hypothetical protein